MKFRTGFIGFMGLLGLVTAAMSLFSPSTAVNEDNLGVTALSNLRAYAGAGLVMALFALYSLSRKHLQDIALTMLIISLTGWDIGQIISYVADGKPDSFTTGSIVVQALLIPVAWKALKSK
jgi:NhaP-type Na+/H+ or K+/H+ antiporter